MGDLKLIKPQNWYGQALLAALAIVSFVPACGQTPNPNIPSYFEFGTVVALGQKNVDIQLYDERKQRIVQHSFVLSRETRADVVHVGDTV